MKNQEKESPLGLDVGTSRICLARRGDGPTEYETQLNAFVSVPKSPITERVLGKEKIPHTVRDSDILVHGNEAGRLAGMLGIETRRTMTRGMLNPEEPDSVAVLKDMIQAATRRYGEQSERRVCFTVPAAPLGANDRLTYHEATVKQILTESGFHATPVNEGLAAVYAELEASNYSGIGISCGAGLCNVCLAYLAVPIVSFSVPQAGDYIDSSAAAVTGERANRVRILKEESFHFNGFFSDQLHQALGVYHDSMIESLVESMALALSGAGKAVRSNRPVPIVLTGGSVMPAGFRDRFENILRRRAFPLPVSEVLLAPDPLHSAAKGALAAALTGS